MEDLEGLCECPSGELEAVLAGTRAVSPLTALRVANAIGCWAEDLHYEGEGPIREWFAELPPSLQQPALDEFWGRGRKRLP